MEHQYNGVELKLTYARDTLASLQCLWRRPVHIETVLEDQVTILTFDGSEHTSTVTEEMAEAAAD